MENSDKRTPFERRLDALIDDEIETALQATQAIQREEFAAEGFTHGICTWSPEIVKGAAARPFRA